MAPSNKGLIKTKEHCTQAALPFNKPAYVEATEQGTNLGNGVSQVVSVVEAAQISSDEDDSLSVNTEARYTYELDRYAKNAMLILSHKHHRNAEFMILKLTETFRKFRFEVEVYQIQDSDEIATTCEKFFSMDFTNYGSVAVVLLAETNRNCLLEVNGSTYEEQTVRRHLTDMMPPTLLDKPKIYMLETYGLYRSARAKLYHPDILEFILPMSFSVVSTFDVQHQQLEHSRPLEMLCKNVSELGDHQDLNTILQIFNILWPASYDYRCLYSSTLKKELRLARSVDTQQP